MVSKSRSRLHYIYSVLYTMHEKYIEVIRAYMEEREGEIIVPDEMMNDIVALIILCYVGDTDEED